MLSALRRDQQTALIWRVLLTQMNFLHLYATIDKNLPQECQGQRRQKKMTLELGQKKTHRGTPSWASQDGAL